MTRRGQVWNRAGAELLSKYGTYGVEVIDEFKETFNYNDIKTEGNTVLLLLLASNEAVRLKAENERYKAYNENLLRQL